MTNGTDHVFNASFHSADPHHADLPLILDAISWRDAAAYCREHKCCVTLTGACGVTEAVLDENGDAKPDDEYLDSWSDR